MLKKILEILPKKQKKKILNSQILFITQGIFEAAGVASIIPLMYVVTAKDKNTILEKFFFLEKLIENFNLHQVQIICISLFIAYIVILNLCVIFNFIIGEEIVKNFYHDIFSKLVDNYFLFDPNSFTKVQTSERINNLSYNIQMSTIFVFTNIIRSFPKFYSLLFILITMLYIDFFKTIIFVLFFMGVYFIILKKLEKNLKFLGSSTSIENRNIIKNIKEVFDNIKIIHIDKLYQFVSPKLKNFGLSWKESHKKLQIITFVLKVFVELSAVLIISSFMIFILYKDIGDTLVPTISFFLYGFYRAFPCMQTIFLTITTGKAWSNVLDQVAESINLKPSHIIYGKDKIEFHENILLKNVSYKFFDDKKYTLSEKNIEIKKGSIIGVKGESGSGKTTFLDLVSGIKSPTKGNIIIDGVNLGANNIFDWFNKISYVPQRVFLFNDTIRLNIVVNNENITNEKELQQIIKTSDLEELTNASKDNFNLDSVITESNNNLSGGEIQRIGIARALVKKPELLILDETTSGVQFEKEKQILKNIKNLLPDITLILVSHRDKSLELCNEVLLFEK